MWHSWKEQELLPLQMISAVLYYFIFNLGTWPSYLMDLLSPRLVGGVGDRNYMSSFSQSALSMTRA